MPHTTFYSFFPEIAEKETKTIIILDKKDTGLPRGKYGLIDLYCTDLNCDCRNVFIQVFNWETDKSPATISYGWEPLKFYKAWMGLKEDEEDGMIKSFKGPGLVPSAVQSKYANIWLALFKQLILTDNDYRDRLKRHYRLVKEVVDNKKAL